MARKSTNSKVREKQIDALVQVIVAAMPWLSLVTVVLCTPLWLPDITNMVTSVADSLAGKNTRISGIWGGSSVTVNVFLGGTWYFQRRRNKKLSARLLVVRAEKDALDKARLEASSPGKSQGEAQ